jgi:hypothetical protein
VKDRTAIVLIAIGVILICGLAFGACSWEAYRTQRLWNSVSPKNPITFWDAFFAGDKIRVTPTGSER